MKISESYQKIISGGKNIKAQNSIDMIQALKKNDITKILSKYKGTEKLIQLLKDGYNDTVRELIFEISSLKNFIFEFNSELVKFIEKSDGKAVKIQDNFIEMPFLDTIYNLKNIINYNLSVIMNNPICKTNILNQIEENENNENNKEEINLNEEKNLGISHISKRESLFDDELSGRESNINKEIKSSKIVDNDDLNVDYNELEILKKKWIHTLMGKNDEINK